jgi:Ca2+-transporting ATPase
MVGLASAIVTGLLVLVKAPAITNSVIIDVIVLIIAISVSVFPEGFPVVLVTTLSSGAYRMAKKNAVVNRMSIIETLGETTVICTDKTGTITKGEMTVRKCFLMILFMISQALVLKTKEVF